MCDAPVPCQCTLDQRVKLQRQHIDRRDRLQFLAYRLHEAGHAAADVELLYQQAEHEWDDGIHIASPDDPLRSLCGLYGRNLCDSPERPDGMAGCWQCLVLSDEGAEVVRTADEALAVA